jgi:hypothetical protein
MKTNTHFSLYLAHFFLERDIFQINFVEEVKTHILCSITFLFPLENRAFCEIKWKNTVEQDIPQMTIWTMHIACSILKATNTHSEYAVFIAFSLQQWLHEIASMLC